MQLWQGQEGKLVNTLACAILFSVLISVAYARWRRYVEVQSFKRKHGCQDPPRYPHQDRIWGSDLVRERMEAMKNGVYFKLYLSHFERYGKTFEEKTRGQKTINTIEPANIQHVLALATEDYGKDPVRVKAQAPFLGPSVFSDGALWKQSRALVKPAFARAELSDVDHLASYADRFMDLIPGDGSMVDIQPLLHRLFLDVSTDFLFGRSVNSLHSKMPAESVEFVQAFAKALKWVTKRREAGWLHFRYNFNKDWVNSYTIVHRFVDQQVKRALEDTKKGAEVQLDSAPVRKRFVLLDELAKVIREPLELRYQILGVSVPARDGTSVAIGNTLFQLAWHPHIWTKLRATSTELVGEPLTFEKLKSLVDFRYVVQETIRLIGPAGRVVRIAVRDTFLPSGGGPDRRSPVFVAKGTDVSLATWCVQHDADIWGHDVQEFKPERWRDRKVFWEFVPFSGGPRICPAQQQVMIHTIYILVRLTQRFESIQNCDPVLEYVEKFNLGFESRNGVKVAFKQAS